MARKIKYGEDSIAVQAHLNITQSVIQRMATNSGTCKAWCITLVSAILVIIADKGKPDFAFIAIVPTVLFLVLDTYYLSLERRFRNSYKVFIEKLHRGKLGYSDLYAMAPSGSALRIFFESIFSFSVWPFYLTLGFMIWITKCVVIP
jgi:hypothetical protein